MAGGMKNYLRVSGGALILGAVLTVGSIVVVFGGEAAISRTEFCVSCHSETYPYEELKKSSHWGALGADPGCKDCHVPQGLSNFHLAVWTHVVDGVPFLIQEFTNDYSTIKDEPHVLQEISNCLKVRSLAGALPLYAASRQV